MADQQSTFSAVVERIEAPVHRLTVGWGDMGRTWVVSLPGSMTPDAVEAVAQTMRRAVGAAVESERRESAARLALLEKELAHRADGAPAQWTSDHAKELGILRSTMWMWQYSAMSVGELADDRGVAVDILGAEVEELRAGFALQKQIAEGATLQRDEQTARLGNALKEVERLQDIERRWYEASSIALEHLGPFIDVGDHCFERGIPAVAAKLKTALADVERLTKAREAWLDEDTRWMQRVMGLEIELRRVTGERDELKTKLETAQRLWESMKADKAELDALKAGKRVVDIDELSEVAFREFRDHPSFVVRECVFASIRAVVAHLGLTPTSEQAGEVGT